MVDARITHAIAEILRNGDPDARITHTLAEVLRDGDPDARITHVVAEILRQISTTTTTSSTSTTSTTTTTFTTTTTGPPPDVRVTHILAEVLRDGDPDVRVTHILAEVLRDVTTTTYTTTSHSTTSTTSSTASTTSTFSTTTSSSTTTTVSSSSTTTTPPPEYWHTDFREYEVDVSPAGWTEKWHPTSGVPTIRDDGVIGTNCLEIVGADERYGLSWDVVGDQDDVEILAKVKVRENVDISAFLVARGSGTGDADENAYYATLYNSSNLILIRKYVAGSSLSITSDSFTVATNSWYWMRFRVFGSSLKLRVWADGDAEPGTWQLEDTDTDVSGVGWVGAGTFYNGPDYDFFSVASNGGTALSPSGTTTTTTSSSTTTSTETYTGSTTTHSSTSSTASTTSTFSTTSSTASTTSSSVTTTSSSTTTTTTYPPCFWNDDFTGTDLYPPYPVKWQNDCLGSGTATLASNKLRIHNAGGASNLGAVSSRGVFSGDFEVEVDIDGIIVPFEDSWSGRLLVYVDSVHYIYVDIHFESATDTWSVGYRKSGGEKYPDSAPRVNEYGSLKITRTGSICRTYYDDGRTGTWTELNVGGQNIDSGDATVSLQCVTWEFDAAVTIDFDNFYVDYDGCPESVTTTTSSTTSSTTTTVTESSTTSTSTSTTATSTSSTITSTSSSTASTTSTFSTTTSTASTSSTYSTTSSTASTTSTFSTTSTTETGWTSTSSTSSTASTTSTFSTTSTTETAPPPPDIASYTMVIVTTG